MNNVFVLCAGRTASTCFANACKHITNYSSAHESKVGCLGLERVNYRSDHIEVDNRLVWFLERLQQQFGDSAYYIYLTRDKHLIAESYCKRWHLNESIVKAYGHGLLMKHKISSRDRMAICLDYAETVEGKIRHFLQHKSNTLTIDVDDLAARFSEFFQLIGAEGNLDACLTELNKVVNKNSPNKFRKVWGLAAKLFDQEK